nr:MAG TPA: hypothetical protein [Caudoviricetes sp.]
MTIWMFSIMLLSVLASDLARWLVDMVLQYGK